MDISPTPRTSANTIRRIIFRCHSVIVRYYYYRIHLSAYRNNAWTDSVGKLRAYLCGIEPPLRHIGMEGRKRQSVTAITIRSSGSHDQRAIAGLVLLDPRRAETCTCCNPPSSSRLWRPTCIGSRRRTAILLPLLESGLHLRQRRL